MNMGDPVKYERSGNPSYNRIVLKRGSYTEGISAKEAKTHLCYNPVCFAVVMRLQCSIFIVTNQSELQ